MREATPLVVGKGDRIPRAIEPTLVADQATPQYHSQVGLQTTIEECP